MEEHLKRNGVVVISGRRPEKLLPLLSDCCVLSYIRVIVILVCLDIYTCFEYIIYASKCFA